MTATLAPALRLVRPEQWVKNAFICAGVLFGGHLVDVAAVRAMVLAVLAFSMGASSVYVLNDYLDRDADRLHPTKRSRPLAVGAVSSRSALAIALACLALGLLLANLAGWRVLVLLGLYLAINVAYALKLKHEAVIDVFCIAAGFMLRLLAGTTGIGIAPSGWLLLTGMFVTLFLGFSKRRAEWARAGGTGGTRQVLADYSAPMLDAFLAITATGTVLCYGLYTLDPQTVALHGTQRLIVTVPLVLFGIFRYLYILYRTNEGENPTRDLFADPQLLGCGIAYVMLVVLILYHR